MTFISLSLIPLFALSTARALPDSPQPLRYAKLRGTIEKTTVADLSSVKSGLAPKKEKVCDFDVNVPVVGHFEGEVMASSTPCSSTLVGKPAKIYVMSRIYPEAGAKNKNIKKAFDLILFVESPLFPSAKSFAMGASTPNISLKTLSLWSNTPVFQDEAKQPKSGESFAVEVTFDDAGK